MKILCFGSLNLDHVYQVDQIVRKGETVKALSRAEHCGGKGLNQSISLAKAGAIVFHAGSIGKDGAKLVEKLNQSGVDTTLVTVNQKDATGHAIIQVDCHGQNGIIYFAGANETITKSQVDSTLKHFSKGDIVLLQNEISNLSYILQTAHKLGLRIALNPSPIDNSLVDLENLQFVDWFILNEIEGNAFTNEVNSENICRLLSRKYPKAVIVLTLGEKGCLLFDGRNFHHHGSYKVTAIDTTAAGDTFTGYFLAGISRNEPIDTILEIASKAAAVTVTRAGAADSIPHRSEVEMLLQSAVK